MTVIDTEHVSKTVPETVRALVRIAGLTQLNLSDHLGISRQVVQMRMTEVSKWQFDELAKLAALFGVPIALLFEETNVAIRSAVNDYNLALRFKKGKRLSDAEIAEIYGLDQVEPASGWTGVYADQAA